jgi:hypothetical protein
MGYPYVAEDMVGGAIIQEPADVFFCSVAIFVMNDLVVKPLSLTSASL